MDAGWFTIRSGRFVLPGSQESHSHLGRDEDSIAFQPAIVNARPRLRLGF